MRWLRLASAAISMTAASHCPAAFAQSAVSRAACVAYAPEAAVRSGLGVDVITRVMLVESRGHPRAVSPKGAIGCMQIMPATWAYLSQRYGLGLDPFDARMNMIGGALYLAELTRKFGLRGAFAAYNAGPARYSRYAVNGVALPGETVAYAARLGGAGAPAIAGASRARWQEASLFLGSSSERRAHATDAAHREPATSLDAGRAPVPENEPRAFRAATTLFPLSAEALPDRQ